MSKFIGRRGAIGLAKEATAGTIVSPTLYLPWTTLSFDDRTTTVVEEEGLGRIEDSDARHQTLRFGEGDIEGELEDIRLGLFLTSLFGASPVTAGGPTYTHTYTLSNTNTHQSLSIAYIDPDQTKIFPYSVINSLQIVVEPENIVTYTAGFMSRISRDWTALTPSFTTLGNKFLPQHLVFKLASAVGGLSGASNISLKRLELNITANSQADNVTGTAEPETILNHQFMVEGSITLNKEDDTYRDYFLDNTYRAMEITLERASNSKLQLQFPRVSFSEWEQDRSLDEIVGQTLSFKGHYDAANASAIVSTAILTNTNNGGSY